MQSPYTLSIPLIVFKTKGKNFAYFRLCIFLELSYQPLSKALSLCDKIMSIGSTYKYYLR